MEKLNFSRFGQWAQSYDPDLLLKLKVDSYNASDGDLTGHDCKVCRNRGHIAFAAEDRVAFRDCSCMRIRRCVWEMEKSGLQNSIRELTFEAFQTTEPWQETIKQGTMDYAQSMDGWLLLCGQSGSGKTHLCTAVCRLALLSGREVRYMPWREKVGQLKAWALEAESRERMLNEYKKAEILYIDDLYKGGESPSAADVALSFELINYRYINHLITLISTEKTPQELIAIDQATGSRMIEMAGDYVFDVSKDLRRNYRLRNIKSI